MKGVASLISLGALRLLSAALGSVLFIVTARLLTTEDFGRLQSALAYASFFAIIFGIGFPQLIPSIFAKDFAEKKLDVIAFNILCVSFLTALTAFAALLLDFMVLFFLGDYRGYFLPVTFAIVCASLLSFQCVFGEVLRSSGRNASSFILLNYVLQSFSALFLFVSTSFFMRINFEAALAISVLSLFLPVAFGAIIIARALGYNFSELNGALFSFSDLKSFVVRYFSRAIYTLLNSIAVFALLQGGGVVAASSVNKLDAALFFASQKVASQIMVFGTIIFYNMPRRFALMDKKQSDAIRSTYNRSCYLAAAIVAPIFFVMVCFPKIIMTVIFGADYIGASAELVVLSAAVFLNLITGQRSVLLINFGFSFDVLRSTIISAPISIFAMFYFAHEAGGLGIAYGVFCGYILQIILECLYVRKRFGFYPLF